MPRPVWSGTISFGLVNIPVKMFNSIKKAPIHFHQLRKSDGCRIAYKKVCAADDKEVGPEEIVRGFEISPDRYIVITEKELSALYPEATRSIEIDDFIKLEQVDSIFFERSFYLTPEQGAGKAYALLYKVLKTTGKAALARLVLRGKEYLATIRPLGGALGITTLLFADEIVSSEEFGDLLPPEGQPDKRELQMAKDLIAALAADFDPDSLCDTCSQKVRDFLATKAEKTWAVSPAAKENAKVIDIMKALEASLATARNKQSAVKVDLPVGKAKAAKSKIEPSRRRKVKPAK